MDIQKTLNQNWIEISLDAVRHNVRVLKSRAGRGCLLTACVKSDAYGHGLVPVARAAVRAGADRLSVAEIKEGIALREAGIAVPILVLIEPLAGQAENFWAYDLIASVSTPEAAQGMADRLGGRCITVHVEVDTGMGRVGLKPEDAPEFLRFLKSLNSYRVEGVFSHFAAAGSPKNAEFHRRTMHQIGRFRETVAACEAAGYRIPIKHMAGSDAVAFYPESFFDMIRPGAWIYGYKSGSIGLELRPVLSWKTRVLSVIDAPRGIPIGYEGAYCPEYDARIAILTTGYGYGYPRSLSGKAQVLVRGRRADVVGLVGMDQTMADVTHIPLVRRNDVAVLIGKEGEEEVTASELGAHLGMFGAMITCGIKERAKRFYFNP